MPAETLKGLEQRATRALPFAVVAPCSGCGEERGTGDSSPLQKRTENCLCVIPDSLFSFLPPFLPYFNFVQQWGNNVGMKRERDRERERTENERSLCVPDPIRRRRHKKGRRYCMRQQQNNVRADWLVSSNLEFWICYRTTRRAVI